MTQVSEVAKPDDGAPRVIVDFMIEAIPKLGAEILSRHGVDQTTGLGVHAGTALATLLRTPETPRESLRVLAETSSQGLRRVAEAYARFEPTGGYTEADLSLLRTMFRSDDAVVLQYASRVARQVARGDKSLAVSLACSVDLVAAGRALHELFMWLSHRDTIPRECIGDEQWKQLLANLEPVDKLDDYWIRRFLKDALNVVPDDLLEFLKNRLQRVTNAENWSYRATDQAIQRGGEPWSIEFTRSREACALASCVGIGARNRQCNDASFRSRCSSPLRQVRPRVHGSVGAVDG